MPVKITEPGIYEMSNEDYHADPCPEPSVSNSDAKLILQKSPAHFRFKKDNPEEPSQTLEFGTIAHRLILEGNANGIEIIDAGDYRTKAAKEQRDLARENGITPLLPHEWEEVQAMKEALEAHEWAMSAFSNGQPEKSMFWKDYNHGLWRRARLDWMPNSGRIFPDYKTIHSAHPEDCRKALYDQLYCMQPAWYMDGLRALGICERPVFLFVFQEKKPPYAVTVVQASNAAVGKGHMLANKALHTYAQCLKTGYWPSYSNEILTLDLSVWAERKVDDMADYDPAHALQNPQGPSAVPAAAE